MMKKLLVILFLFLNFDTQALSKELSCKNNPKCKNFPKVTKIKGIKYPLTMVQKQRGEKLPFLLSVQKFTANLYCICLSVHETWA